MEIIKVMKSYDGSGDVGAWIAKLRLTAKLLSLKDVATVLPMLLEGPAFAVFSQMEEDKKDSDSEIEKALQDAFNVSSFEAYERFRSKTWVGEPADVFLADLRSLAKRTGDVSEDVIKCAFVVGMPGDVSSQLRASSKISAMLIVEVVAQARALLSSRIEHVALAAK